MCQLYMEKELKMNRIAGPFEEPPLDNFRISPLSCVPKKEPNSFRIIYDLSYPKGNSIIIKEVSIYPVTGCARKD